MQRQVVQPYNSAALSNNPANLFAFTSPTATQVIVQDGAILRYATGGPWATVATMPTATKCQAAVFNNRIYFQNGVDAPRAWDGAAAYTMGQSWNETIGSYGGAYGGNVPIAKYACAHLGRMWVAYTTESGTAYPNRVRFSHANRAEDWRQEDFIDIDVGRDGDYITAIIEFRERLYIFKNHSISMITGYGTQNFQVVPIEQDIGCVGQNAVVNSDVGLFFFSWPQGVYLDTGRGPYPIYDKIWPSIRDDFIPAAYRGNIALGWINKMLWASVPWNGSSVNARTLIYNPWIWRLRYMRFLQGPWYPYSIGASAFARLDQPSGPTLWLAAGANVPYVATVENDGNSDNWGGRVTPIQSYYTTKWYDMGQEAIHKRWRQPDIVMRAGASSNLRVDVKKNYDPSTLYKSFYIGQTSATGTLVWNGATAQTWATITPESWSVETGTWAAFGQQGGTWDDGSGTLGGQWAALPSTGENIERGSFMGSARSVQMTFTGPLNTFWGVDAVTMKYIIKTVRG